MGRNGYHVESNCTTSPDLKGQAEIEKYCDKIANGFVYKNGLNGLNGKSNGHTNVKPIVSNKYQESSIATSNLLNNVTFQDTFYKDASGKPIRKKKRAKREIHESFEQCSYWDAFCTYMCYFVLVVVGYANDIIRPLAEKEKNRNVSLQHF